MGWIPTTITRLSSDENDRQTELGIVNASGENGYKIHQELQTKKYILFTCVLKSACKSVGMSYLVLYLSLEFTFMVSLLCYSAG